MNQGKICVSICGETADEVLDRIRGGGELADMIEIRFDCLRPEEIRPVVEHLASLNKQLLLITFRPMEQGGKRELSVEDRIKFWEFIRPQLEGIDFLTDRELDLDFPLIAKSEPSIVSRHHFEGAHTDLQELLSTLEKRAERIIKVAVSVEDATEAVEVWKLLEKTSKQVIPIAMGEAGKWTRILGLAHGVPITYASLENREQTAPGQISARDLRDVFRVKELDEETGVLGVVAGDTSYSLSPYMHNAAFKHTELNFVFVPLQVRDLDGFLRRMVKPDTREVELNFKGFSVTNPHKQSIMRHLDFVDETAQKIGAVNTVNVEGGKLSGYNTDAPGFIAPLKKLYGDLNGARVSVVGAGGGARACVYSLQQEGADVTVLARDAAKAAAFAEEFGVRGAGLTTEKRRLAADILVNATPLGTKGEAEGHAIASSNELRDVKLVYDLVYNPGETRLLREAKIVGAKTLGGIEMLVAQGAQQFVIWTGGEAPVDVMKAAVTARLS